MNAILTDNWFLVLRHRRMMTSVLLRLFFAVLILVALMQSSDGMREVLGTYLLLFTAGYPAFLLSFAQKDVLASSFSFQQPRLRQRFLLAQMTWAVTAGLAVGLLAAVAPTTPAGFGAAHLISFGALASSHYLVMAILSFESNWAAQLPTLLYVSLILAGKSSTSGTVETVERLFAQPWGWLAGAVVLGGALAWRLLTPGLHRKLSGSVVLMPTSAFNVPRLQEWRLARDRYRGDHGPSRLRGYLFGALLARATAARGRPVWVAAWRLVHAGLGTYLPRSRRGRWTAVLVISGLILVAGYADVGPSPDSSRYGWYSTMILALAVMPAVSVCLAMNGRYAVPTARRDGAAAELRALAVTTAVVIFCVGVLWGVGQVLAQAVPFFEFGGEIYTFAPAQKHGPIAAVLVVPWLWLMAAVRPRPGCQLPSYAQFAFFILGHTLMSVIPYEIVIPAWTLASLAAGAGAYALRRRWWRKADRRDR